MDGIRSKIQVMRNVLLFPFQVAAMWVVGLVLGIVGALPITAVALCEALYSLKPEKWAGLDVLYIRLSRVYGTPQFGNRVVMAFKWRWLQKYWGNEEDGVSGGSWYLNYLVSHGKRWPLARRIWAWSVWRNSVNNLRFNVPWAFDINQFEIKVYGNSENPKLDSVRYAGVHWWWIQHGLYSGLAVAIGGHGFWVGWKLKPSDRPATFDPTSRRTKGVAFATGPI